MEKEHKNSATDNESELFRQAVGKVQPLKSDNQALISAKKPKPIPTARQEAAPEQFVLESTQGIEKLQQEDSMSYALPGVQQNVLKKLRKGHFEVTAQIDLHGLTSRKAKHQLLQFIQSCIEDGVRCAHIIHGKGYGSTDQQPVLKNDVNVWLRQHPGILAFCSAPRQQGGTGALYALLRSSEKYSEQDNTEY